MQAHRAGRQRGLRGDAGNPLGGLRDRHRDLVGEFR